MLLYRAWNDPNLPYLVNKKKLLSLSIFIQDSCAWEIFSRHCHCKVSSSLTDQQTNNNERKKESLDRVIIIEIGFFIMLDSNKFNIDLLLKILYETEVRSEMK